MTVLTVETENDIIRELAKLLEDAANKTLQANALFKVGLSGGSVIKFLSASLSTIHTDFTRWRFFFCDERIVPYEDPESTFGAYEDLRNQLNLRDEQFVSIKQGVSPDQAAKDYVQQMLHYFPEGSLPRFDVLLLGMGPDGHTCSLFPGHKLLDERSVWVAPITDSPKPPPARITLTFPVINNAKRCVFAVAGEGKADIVKRILVDKEDLPAGRVKPTSGSLYWILDKGAAKHLQ